jgi:predicted house-cleaning noncanonical NTP pyrophosphatase (MazG superfamily)
VSKKVYNKLVRSEIPDIIKSEGRECTYIELNSDDDKDLKIIKKMLKEKLVEEAQEVQESTHKSSILEEIGDVLDVIDEILDIHSEMLYVGSDIRKELEVIRKAKSIQKGRFLKKVHGQNGCEFKYIKLLSVDDEN